MDENRLPELPQEAFRPMIAQSVQLEQFLGEELIFCFRDLDGVHTFTTCYGDIYKTVNALRDYVRLLESVCDQWELTGFHRATYEYHAEKLRKIADKLQAGIGYDYDKAVERCKKKRARKSHSNDVGEDALLLTVRAAGKSARSTSTEAYSLAYVAGRRATENAASSLLQHPPTDERRASYTPPPHPP